VKQIQRGSTMLTKYQGEKITRDAFAKDLLIYTMCLNVTTYIQAKVGKHMQVNHSCQPVGQLLNWMDRNGNE
jgi:hypothetical protein